MPRWGARWRKASEPGRAASRAWRISSAPRWIIMQRSARFTAGGGRRRFVTRIRTCRTPVSGPGATRRGRRSSIRLRRADGGFPRMIRRVAATGAVILVLTILAAAPRAQVSADPRAFVGSLGARAIEVLGPSVPPQQRQARFRELLQNDFDVPSIGQFVLGRYWRAATPQEQQEFLQLFQEYVVQAYSARLGEYGGGALPGSGRRAAGGEGRGPRALRRSR